MEELVLKMAQAIKRLLCQPDSCNLGTCVQGERMFTCKCPPGFEGPTCGINRDDCREVVCQHGGACIDEINGFRCKCTRFWKGTLCNINR
ncbi:EGF-like domain protein [Trichuris suis]|nr:EGF-like domain protein [Trichuris suis]